MGEITHRTVETNGISMHIAEAGKGPLVILCHGFPESWYSWRHQLPALAARGYHAVAPDQRGYGRTDAPADITSYTQFHLVGDIVGLVRALGEDQAVIVGHDWGAPVAWNAAMWRPDIFRAVVGMSVPATDRPHGAPTAFMKQRFGDTFFYMLYFQTPGVAEHELQKDVRRTLRMLLYSASGAGIENAFGRLPKTAGFLDQMTEPEALPDWLTEEDLDYFTDEFQRAGFRGGLNWYRNIDRNWELSAPFAGRRIEQPALFITGDRDLTLAMPGYEERMRAVVPNLGEVVTFAGIGHWTQQENPEGTNAAMLDFLDSLDGQESATT
ncbi:MAG: alpha/beta hydrolase [Gammaproteobacteria bacterium]|nr:alpha/beta hydrolase [Gammaproteobacteria bacterium]